MSDFLPGGARVVRRGDSGPAVAAICALLVRTGDLHAVPSVADGAGFPEFDDAVERAVRAFQQRRGLLSDGIVGPATAAVLDGAGLQLGDRRLRHDPATPMEGDDVTQLQRQLETLGFRPGKVDGVFGPRTQMAVSTFQTASGLDDDGSVGPETVGAFGRLRRAVVGGSAADLHDRERLRRGGQHLSGRVVMLDAGHGGNDTGVTAHGLSEAEVVGDIVHRIATRLAAHDVQVLLTRDPGRDPARDDEPLTELDRAVRANEAGADVLLSVHCDHSSTEQARGVATYYYGDPDRHVASTVGAHWADLIHREVVARTGMVDCRTHARTWELLRRTQMPAVRLEIGYLSHPDDAALLGQARVRDQLADAVVVAVQRLVLGEQDTMQTGRIDVRELRRHLEQLRAQQQSAVEQL